jgi:hypothetical protein
VFGHEHHGLGRINPLRGFDQPMGVLGCAQRQQYEFGRGGLDGLFGELRIVGAFGQQAGSRVGE